VRKDREGRAGKTQEIQELTRKGLTKSAIAKQLNIGRTTVRRLLADA
jgi:putative DNA-invertase from lambdoid prophage Rac